jgi:hypothetical protein
VGTLTGEEFCGGETDTLSTARNDGHFPLQFTQCSFSRLLVAFLCDVEERHHQYSANRESFVPSLGAFPAFLLMPLRLDA